MVSIVTGSGNGLVNTSKDVLGSAGELGQAATGRAGEQITVNAANGNLVVQDRDEYLVGSGPGVDLLRTYNSQGGWDGDNNDGWRIGYYRKVYDLVGNTIKRVEADGQVATYTFDSARSAYVTTDGSGQRDTLSYDAPSDTWTWTDGDTRTTETYRLYGAGNYRLTRVTSVEGHYTEVSYSADLISQVATFKAGGTAEGVIKLVYEGTLLRRTEAFENGTKTRTLTQYEYDTAGKLSKVTTDLSPGDSSTSDGKVYVTTYGYAYYGLLSSIQQTDGTQLTFEHYGGRVSLITDDRTTLRTTFSYDTAARTTDVRTVNTYYGSDPLNQVKRLGYTASGQLWFIHDVIGGPAYEQRAFGYNASGDLTSISVNATPETSRQSYTYAYDGPGGANGAWTRRTDATGCVVERSYDPATGLLLSETSYATRDPDGVTGSALPGDPRKTLYIYDTTQPAKRRLAYVVGPQGEVTRYSYDTQGRLQRQLQYTRARYTVANPTFATLQSWADGPPQALTLDRQVTEYSYDVRGQLAQERRYTSARVNNGAVIDEGPSITIYVYDASGRLLSKQDASGVTLAYEYDGLGRVTKTRDTRGTDTLYSYDDAGRKTSVQLANGQTTVQFFDVRGNLISSDVMGAGNTPEAPKWLGKTNYTYDILGRLRIVTHPNGGTQSFVYDERGRKTAEVVNGTQFTEFFYDNQGHLVQEVAYNNALSDSARSYLTESYQVNSNYFTNNNNYRPYADTTVDRVTNHYYDVAGRRIATLDAEYYLSTVQYDGTGAVASETRYANAVVVPRYNAEEANWTAAVNRYQLLAVPTASPDATRDRTTRYLYDTSGRLAGQVDADGGLTLWTYDAAGNRLSQLRRSQLLSDAQRISANLATLAALPGLADDEFTQWLYDGQGRQIAQLSAEGHLTEYGYDAAGRLATTSRYLTQAFKPVNSSGARRELLRTDPNTLRPSLGTALKTTRTYNNLGLLERETAIDSTVTYYQYDNLQRLKSTTLAEGSAEQRVQLLGYDDWGRVNDTRMDGDATGTTRTYDAAGRVTSVTNARGHKTFYYYDARGNLISTILVDPVLGGEVRTVGYNIFGEVTANVAYSARLSATVANGLSPGWLTDAQYKQLNWLGGTAYQARTDFTYNRRGLIQTAIDVMGYVTHSAYNAFGQLAMRSIDLYSGAARGGSTTYTYNRRGLSTGTTRAAATLAIVATTASDFDALGRLTYTTDELNRRTDYVYSREDGNGRKVEIRGPAATTSTRYDALDRVVSQLDGNGNTVTYTHDAVNRKLTMKTAELIEVVTEYTRHGQVCKVTDGTGAATTYTYDTHGNLLTSTDALGIVTKNVYDANDNRTRVTLGLRANGSGDPINDGSATVTSYTFDAANRVLTQTVDPDGLAIKTTYTYDGQGRKLSIKDARGVITSQVFNGKGELADVIVDDVAGGLQLKTTYTYNATSQVLTVTEGAGTAASRKTQYDYDAFGRRIAEIIDPAGAKIKTTLEYDVRNRLVVKKDTLNQVVARYRYDGADRLSYTIDGIGGVVRYYYDGEGRLTSTVAYATPLATGWASKTDADLDTALAALSAGSNPSDRLSLNAYDKDGRLVYSVDALGYVAGRQYDKAGRVILERRYANAVTGVVAGQAALVIQGKLVPSDTLDHVTRYVYDKVGHQRFVINAERFVSELRYDAAGRVLSSVQHPLAWSASIGSVPSEAEMTQAYSPTKREFNTALEGFTTGTPSAIFWEGGRMKLVSKQAASTTWPLMGSTKLMPVGASLKLDVTPAQLQRSFHVIMRDGSGATGRVALILEPDGRVLAQTQTPTDPPTYVTFPTGRTYEANKTYTVEIETSAKGAKLYFYAQGTERTLAYEIVEPSFKWQTVRTDIVVKHDPSFTSETAIYVDNVEENPQGRVTQYAYDAAGRQRFAVDAEGYVTETRYDVNTGRTTTLRYNNRINGSSGYTAATAAPKLASIEAAAATLGSANSVWFELDTAGRMSTETDGNGVQKKYTYDAAGRLETEVEAANIAGQASTTRYRYNAAGLRTQVTRADGTAAASTTRFEYDALGRLSKTIDARAVAILEGAGAWEVAERARWMSLGISTLDAPGIAKVLDRYTTETRYDAAGRVSQVIRKASSAASETTTTLTTTTEYDAFGNAVKLTDARGAISYQVFDKLGRVKQRIDAEKYLTVYDYDPFGNLRSTLKLDARVQGTFTAGQAVTVASTAPGSGPYVLSSTALDHLTKWEYDRNDRLLRETDAETYVEGSVGTLDAFGQRTTVSNKLGATVSYTYDRLGRLLTETLPVQAKDSNDVLKNVVNEYQYDSRGNRIVSIEAKGLVEQRTTQMRYDGAGRLTLRIGMAYGALLSNDTTSSVTVADAFRYDARGNLIEQISHGQLQAGDTVTGGKRTVAWFDALNRQTLEINADRVATRFSYDPTDNVAVRTTYATRIADGVTLDPSGAAPAVTLDLPNDRTLRTRYDELGRRIETSLDNVYIWDAGPTGATLVMGGVQTNVVLERLFYDGEGNLTEVRNGRNGVTGYSTFSYYDGIGRKVLSIDAAGAAIAWDYGSSAVATRETRYSGMLLDGTYSRQTTINDPAGLLTAVKALATHVIADDRITEFTLDRLDRVTEKRVLNVAQDVIDETGRRTQSLASAVTKYTYDGLGNLKQIQELVAQIGATQTWETTDIQYDNLGRETKRQGVEFKDYENQIVRPTTDVEYDGLGQVVRRVLRGKNDAVETDDRITRYQYDKNGALIESTDATLAVTRYEYDANGDLARRTAVGVKRSDGTTTRNIVKRYTLDRAGRITAETTFESDKLAAAETRKTRYNAFGEITARGIGDGYEEFFEYSTMGKIVKTNSGDGSIKFYLYDAAGNQTREIKGNGSISLQGMSLQSAAVSTALYCRYSLYNARNELIRTVDPKMDFLAASQLLSNLYQERWVPAWNPSSASAVDGYFLSQGSPVAAPGTSPKVSLASSNPYFYWGVFNSLADAERGSCSTAGSFANNTITWDVSSLKGQGTKYFKYYVQSAYDGGIVMLCVGQISVSADGSVVSISQSEPKFGVNPYEPSKILFSAPDLTGEWNFRNLYYNITDNATGSTILSGSTQVSSTFGSVSIDGIRPSGAPLSFTLQYQRADSSVSSRAIGSIDNTGHVALQASTTNPADQPATFYVKGRNVKSARLTINGRTEILTGKYTGPGEGVYTSGYTAFVYNAKSIAFSGSTYDFTLELLDEAGRPLLDEIGSPITQDGRVYFDSTLANLPVVQSKITEIRFLKSIMVSRLQEFNAFGEVSEERDERVQDRMLEAINDGLRTSNQTEQTALTLDQKAAARTTLKYNTLGQLVAKIDPETWVTAENGYRYRARPETRYGYDLLGRHTTMLDANGNLSRAQYAAGSRGEGAQVVREFDAAGGNADVFNGTGGGIRQTQYDVFGDARKVIDAEGNVTERTYSKRSELETVTRKGIQRVSDANTGALGGAKDLTDTYTYDQLGQRLTAKNALNITTRTDYDAQQRVVQTVSGNGFVTGYTYELRVSGASGITSLANAVTGGYVRTTLQADGRSLIDKIDYFGHTTWHQDLGGAQYTYAYNGAAQLVKQTSTRGQEVDYGYYANGYILFVKDRTQKILSQYAYDDAGNRVYEGIWDVTYDSLGEATKTTSYQSGTITYDELNRIARVRDKNFFNIAYEFDAVGNRRRILANYWDGLGGELAGGVQDYWYAYDKLNRFTVSKGRLEKAKAATTVRGTSLGDTSVAVARGTEGTLLSYDKLGMRRTATYNYDSYGTSQEIEEFYDYSKDGYLQVTRQQTPTQATRVISTRKLDDLGRTVLQTDLVNLQSTETTYDADNRLMTQKIVDKIYSLDVSGNSTLTYKYYANSTDTTTSTTGTGALSTVVQAPTTGVGSSTTYKYDYWDDAKQSEIHKYSGGQETATTFTYDVNGRIKKTIDQGAGVNREYITNANGQVLRRKGTNGTHYYYYADGNRIGDVGNTPDDRSRVSYAEQLAKRSNMESADARRERYTKPSPVTSADFDQNYQPINDDYPNSAASSYVVRRNGETLRDIAQAVWGDSALWYLIAESNGMLTDAPLTSGRVLVIPNKVTNIHNNSTTWMPYNAGEAIGAVDPNWTLRNTTGFTDLSRQIYQSMSVATGFYRDVKGFTGRDDVPQSVIDMGNQAYLKGMWKLVEDGGLNSKKVPPPPPPPPGAPTPTAPPPQPSKPPKPTGDAAQDRKILQNLLNDPGYSNLVVQEVHSAMGWDVDDLGYLTPAARAAYALDTDSVPAVPDLELATLPNIRQLNLGMYAKYSDLTANRDVLKVVETTSGGRRVAMTIYEPRPPGADAIFRDLQGRTVWGTWVDADVVGDITATSHILPDVPLPSPLYGPHRAAYDNDGKPFIAVPIADGRVRFVVPPEGYEMPSRALLRFQDALSGAVEVLSSVPAGIVDTTLAVADGYREVWDWVSGGTGITPWSQLGKEAHSGRLTISSLVGGVLDNSPLGVFYNVASGDYRAAGRSFVGAGAGLLSGPVTARATSVLSRVPVLGAELHPLQWAGQAALWSLNQATKLARGATAAAAWIGERVGAVSGPFVHAVTIGTRTFAQGALEYLSPRLEQYMFRSGAAMYVIAPELKVQARLQELIAEGHGVQRHGSKVTGIQLEGRAVEGLDPMTGTPVDGVHGGEHHYARHATQVLTDEAYVFAETYARNSQHFIDVTIASTTGRAQLKIPLKDIYGEDFRDFVFGVTRYGSKQTPTGFGNTIFSDNAFMIIRYKQDSTGIWKFNTMFPEPEL